jgi:spermidine/putrescine transport system substrate-binding protein
MHRQILSGALGAGLVLGLAGTAHGEGELFIYTWFDYIPPELVEKFEQEHQVDATVDTYDSNETLLAKLKGGGTGYDIVMPGDYMVAIMIREGMLEQVQPNKMDNFKNVDPRWVDVYWDPGREYSIPYQWGTTSFMVNREAYDGEIDTLAVIFDPPEPLQGEINMMRDVNDVLNMGLRYLGHPRCNDNEEQLRELNDLMQRAKPYWKSFNSDGAKEVLVSGDVQAGMIWNGYGMRARMEKPSLEYAYPKEGFTGWMDNIAVPKGARNLDNAKLFVDFMMAPEHAAMVSNFARYANGIMGSEAFMDPELLSAPEIVIPEGAPAPEFVPPCEDAVIRLYDRIWTNLLR